MEILLRLLCGYDFREGLLFALLYSLGVGFAVNAVSLMFAGQKVSRIIAGTLLGICCFMFALEYFMYSTYKVFMSLDTMLFGAGNVIREFADTLILTIVYGLAEIVAFFLPFIVFLLLTGGLVPFTAGDIAARVRCFSLLVILLVVTVSGQAIILGSRGRDADAYYAEYHFDSTSRRLGLLTGLSLDTRYSIFGNPYADSVFVLEEPFDLDEQNWELPPPALQQRPAYSQLPVIPDEETDLPETAVELALQPSEPPAPEPPPRVEYGYNIIDIDFNALNAGERDSRIRAVNEYVASLEGSRRSEYTGIFKGKNLIILTAEAFSAEVVDAVLTPTLHRLVHNGFYFSDYYQPAWGGSTSSGEFSVLAGIAPTAGARSVQRTVGKNLGYFIGNKLMNLGYFSAAYHNGSYTYYNRDKTHYNFGYSTFTAFGNGMDGYVGIEWPASDLEMMEFSLPQYIDEQPFSVYYMTVSGHCNYSRSVNEMVKKNWDAIPQPEGMSDKIRGYLACNLELEYALDYLVSSLEAAGIADDTVIALSTDHYPYGLEKSDSWGNSRDYLEELYGFQVRTAADRDHSALIIWSGSLENEHRDMAVEVASPVHSLDILPALCNLFGLEYDSRLLVGRDVFSGSEALVFWSDRSWKTDAGYYNASTGVFTPIDALDVPEEYVSRVRSIVNNKITYSDAAISYDYFNILFYPDGTVRES